VRNQREMQVIERTLAFLVVGILLAIGISDETLRLLQQHRPNVKCGVGNYV